jgi:hypothetical protein
VRDLQAKYEHLVEQDSKKAHAARRRAKNAEYTRLLKEDLRKAEAARRRAEKEELERLLEEDTRKAQEAHRQAMEQERRHQAERESMERKRREQEERQRQAEREAMARERRERERREKECREREAAQSSLVTRLRVYEATWAALRSRGAEDLTKERVLAFVCHPLHEHIQGPGGGLAKSLRSEILRWHPDKFEGKVLSKVVEGDRGAAREGAGWVARILTTFGAIIR